MKEWRKLKVCICDYPDFSNMRTLDYSGLYEVSSTGDIRECTTGRLLDKKLNKRGYHVVNLIDSNGMTKEILVHRIVATTFQDKCGKVNEVVNHLDWDKTNNSVENLEWCTNMENLAYGGDPNKNPNLRIPHKKKSLYDRYGIRVIEEDFNWKSKKLINI